MKNVDERYEKYYNVYEDNYDNEEGENKNKKID